jgi:hypothetical protein
VSHSAHSSLPGDVLAWLSKRLAYLIPSRPPGVGGTRPLPLEVCLDAWAAALLDGLSYCRAVGISTTEVGDSLDLLLGSLAEVPCGPVGTAQWVPDVVRLDPVATGAWSGRWMTAGSRASSVRSTRGWSGSCGC